MIAHRKRIVITRSHGYAITIMIYKMSLSALLVATRSIPYVGGARGTHLYSQIRYVMLTSRCSHVAMDTRSLASKVP